MSTQGAYKGAEFEREIAKRLSRWVSGGERTDLYWRTAMSGGRATIANRSGGENRSQLGDLTAVDEEGAPLTNKFVIELKHHRDVGLGSYIVKRTGPIGKWWEKVCQEASDNGKMPMLVFKQNYFPTLLATTVAGSQYIGPTSPVAGISLDATDTQLGVMVLYDFQQVMETADPARVL